MNTQEPQSPPEAPALPGAAVEPAMRAYLAKKIELRSDGDGPLERGSHEAIAVLAAVAAAAPFLREQGVAADGSTLRTRPPGIAPESAVRAAAEAAYESVRPAMGFPTGFADAPPPLQARYMEMQRAAFAAAAPHMAAGAVAP